MGFTIPNEGDAFHADQAEWDSIDVAIMAAGLAGFGVVSGCAVTAQGTPDMTVAVAAGVIRDSDGQTYAVTGGNVTITTANATNPRIDLIVTDGSNSATAGTAAANPVMPAIPANKLVLAAVYVPANDTAIGSTQIIDKRVVLPAPATAAFPLDDYLLASGSARNDEFSAGPGIDGKWTLAGNALDDVDENNDYPERLLLRRNDTGSKISIEYQNLPSLPCDITCHVAASTYQANYARGGGLCLLPASPTDASPALFTGFLYNDARKYESAIYSDLSTYSSTPGGAATIGSVGNGMWLRVTILSGGTTADLYWSIDGFFWTLAVATLALGFTAANAGIGISPEGQAADLQALFDYYRVSA